MRIAQATPLAFLSILAVSVSAPANPVIVDDPLLARAVEAARAETLASRGEGKRLAACLLVKQLDGTWRRGSVDGTTTAYPASAVKLAFMAAAMNYARENGKDYKWLDQHVGPMMRVSSNEATGEVVDAITGTPNAEEGDFDAWMGKRRYTANFLEKRGLLGNQIVLHKTYPSNSGESPAGFEARARKEFGSNAMSPNLMAELLLNIVVGEIEPGAREYMLDLMRHERFSVQSPMGWGVPPSAEYLNKGGWMSTSLCDIAHVELANGTEFILAATSNLYVGADRGGLSNAGLGVFMDGVIEHVGFEGETSSTLRLDNTHPSFSTTGDWLKETKDTDKRGADYRWAEGGSAATARWAINLPEGDYQLSVWWPDGPDRSDSVTVRVGSGPTAAVRVVDQRTAGGLWVPAGTYTLPVRGATVEIDAAASGKGRVCADAIRLQRVPHRS